MTATSKYRILIADDEQPTRNRLKKLNWTTVLPNMINLNVLLPEQKKYYNYILADEKGLQIIQPHLSHNKGKVINFRKLNLTFVSPSHQNFDGLD